MPDADYTVEVDVLRTSRLTARVRVRAANATMAGDIGRAAVRRAFEDDTPQVMITHISKPTYQVLTEVRSAASPGAA